MTTIQRIGVLTSGGDAPGMNAAIRAVVRSGMYNGFSVYGIRRGYEGLLKGDMFEMNLRTVSNIMARGGTVLQTARSKEYATPQGVERAKTMCEVFGLDAVVVIGGDGSFRGARDLAQTGMRVMGIPATIDNDIGCTDYTIGFDTALNTVTDAIDKIKDTAYSHERCSVVEVMGRDAGYIALHAGIANGAEAVLLPEAPFDLHKDIVKPIVDCRNRGKHHYVVVIAEGVGDSAQIAKDIHAITGIPTTTTILGHLQRGGKPTVRDRVNASLMGKRAVDLLKQGVYNRVVALKGEDVVDYDVLQALEMKKEIDPDMILTSRILSL